jgi:hypothetical protein
VLGLGELVSESFARNGIEPRLDLNRVRWSAWFPCEQVLSLPIPSKPGLFALAEEVGMLPVESGGNSLSSKRMLALFQVSETEDLAMALGRLTLPGTSLSRRSAEKRVFARYATIEDADQRRTALAIFRYWIEARGEPGRTSDGAMEIEEIGRHNLSRAG